jgi:hypothetical protein
MAGSLRAFTKRAHSRLRFGRNRIPVDRAEDQGIRLKPAEPDGHPELELASPVRPQSVQGDRWQRHCTTPVRPWSLFEAALDLDRGSTKIDIFQPIARSRRDAAGTERHHSDGSSACPERSQHSVDLIGPQDLISSPEPLAA